MLKKRYENQREILTQTLDRIFNLPHATSESAKHLKNVHDTVYESLMEIKNMDIEIDAWDPLIVHLIMKKLDRETLMHYECQL